MAEIEVSSVPNKITPEKSFVPLYLISQWQEPETTTQRVTVAIILPSGIQAGSFKTRVIEEGDVLEMTVDWPRPLVDIEFMHRKWINNCSENGFTTYHPKFLGFEATLRQMCENRSDTVRSVARIGLPITVQAHITDTNNIEFHDDTSRMVYIDLKAIEEDYAVVKNTSEFEFV